MRDGVKSYRIEGLFPPESSDPALRLIFPSAVKPTGESIDFRLYLEAAAPAERAAQFWVKDLYYHGKLAM